MLWLMLMIGMEQTHRDYTPRSSLFLDFIIIQPTAHLPAGSATSSLCFLRPLQQDMGEGIHATFLSTKTPQIWGKKPSLFDVSIRHSELWMRVSFQSSLLTCGMPTPAALAPWTVQPAWLNRTLEQAKCLGNAEGKSCTPECSILQGSLLLNLLQISPGKPITEIKIALKRI